MTSPQLEHGYTRIANELLEALTRVPLSGSQYAIILALIRITYGYHRKEVVVTNSEIAEMVGRHRTMVAREIAKLIELNVLKEVSPKGYQVSRTIALQKDWFSWRFPNVAETLHNVADPLHQCSENATDFVADSLQPSITYKEIRKDKYPPTPQDEPKTTARTQLKKQARVYSFDPVNDLLTLPTKLSAIPAFPESWAKWVDVRRDNGKPITSHAAAEQLKMLAEQSDPVEVISQSIRCQWQGLFPVKTSQSGGYRGNQNNGRPVRPTSNAVGSAGGVTDQTRRQLAGITDPDERVRKATAWGIIPERLTEAEVRQLR